jgi:glycerol-3-phosphate acyltransferase PlsY
VLLLDYLKGAVPVSLAHFGAGVSGWGLVGVALAPVVGHAYSPLLRFRGGKALASTFGIWTGLMLAEGPLVLGLLLGLFIVLQTNDGWAVFLGFLFFLGYLGLRQANGFIVTVATANALLVAWKYRHYLQSPARLRPRLLAMLRRTSE